MTLESCVTLWETIHSNEKFFDAMSVNPQINRESLFSYLMFEFGTMETVDGNTNTFHERMKNFFKIHKFNIDKLTETTLYKYEPLENYRWTQDRKLERDVGTKNVMGRETSENNSKTTKRNEEDNITGSTAENTTETTSNDTTTNGNDKRTENTTVTNTGVKTEGWSEEGKSKNTAVNLVSAFNDVPSTIDSLRDSEKDRTVTDDSYNKGGDKTTNDNNTETTAGTIDDITAETIDSDGNATKDKTGSESKNTTIEETVTGTETKNGTDDKTDTGTVDEDVTEKITRYGTDGITYQDLISQERREAEFNIYKWIGSHFCKELLIAVW